MHILHLITTDDWLKWAILFGAGSLAKVCFHLASRETRHIYQEHRRNHDKPLRHCRKGACRTIAPRSQTRSQEDLEQSASLVELV